MIKIKGYPGLRRDPKTGAIININAGRNKEPSVNERLEKLEQNVESIMNILKSIQDGVSEVHRNKFLERSFE